MATIKVLSSGAFQICVCSKLLPKPFYASFDTRAEAVAFSDHLTALLKQGVVPELLAAKRGEVQVSWDLQRCIAEYIRSEPLPVSEIKFLDTIRIRLSNVKTRDLNYDWAEAWVRQMKRDDNLAPSTIRHRHGALARCFGWVCRRHPHVLLANPVRLLKRGFATYTEHDAKEVVAHGGTVKVDIERNRRLEDGEECVFHAKWPPVPRQSGHPVHGKLGHSFHAMADSRSVATRGGGSFYYDWPVPVNQFQVFGGRFL